MSHSLRPLYSPWNSTGQNTRVGSLSLFQGIFPTQGLNPGLPPCRHILYQLSHRGRPRILKWVAYPFSSGSSWPRNRTGVSCIAGRFFTNWATREALLNPLGKLILETNLAGDTNHQFLAKFHYFKKSCTKCKARTVSTNTRSSDGAVLVSAFVFIGCFQFWPFVKGFILYFPCSCFQFLKTILKYLEI